MQADAAIGVEARIAHRNRADCYAREIARTQRELGVLASVEAL